MTTNLFSTFRQGENRVTSTFLAVLQRLSLPNIDRIIGALLEDTSFGLVSFDNQPRMKASIPDARIRTGPTIWIETKTSPGAVDLDQIRRHLEGLGNGEHLLLLTPDDSEPKGLSAKVVWSNFRTLAGAVEDILGDENKPPSENEPPSEREAFLLREFILMLRQDGLLDSAEPRVMVLGARMAWPMYKDLSVYRCSLNKPMQPLKEKSDHLAFYVAGQIESLVPKVRSVLEAIDMTQAEEIESLGSNQRILAEELQKKIVHQKQSHEFSQAFKVMFLSEPDNDDTVKLVGPIINDKTDKNGKPTPFTFGQPRYVTLESLKKARKTSELEPC